MKLSKPVSLLATILLMGGVALSACSSVAPAPQPTPSPIRIGVSPWVGFAPLYIARDKGFFAKEGVAVDVVNFDTYDEANTTLASRGIEGNVTVLSDTVAQAAAKVAVQDVWVFDESQGDDVLVGNDSIKSPSDLKGKRVAFSYGTFGQVFVLTALAKYGLSRSDVTVVNLPGENVPDALASGKIDAGHTWDPFLGQALKNGAHTVLTSKDTPGIIVDVLVFRTDVTTNRANDVKAVVRALLNADEYWKQNPDEGNKIVAKAMGVAPGDIPAILTGDRIYSLADVQAAFDPNGAQSIYQSAKTISDFFVKEQVIKQAPDFQALINPTFVQAVSQSK
ncbi:MAG TPA: ABC transporter substrate-binding protein [Aggregatilineales bacterium]|nr:ABC transporter substrate-binding protein [Aggregatilineales bacterium]